jgi:outer membrane cobalamin receptor
MKALLLSAAAVFALASGSAHAQNQKLDTIRVAARAPDPALAATRSIEVIGRDEIAKRAGYDLADILASSIGLDVFRRSAAQSDLSIRGSSFSQVVVLVDGVRVSDAQSGHYNMDLTVPTSSVERIEILRGGASSMYGADAIGGVINIVTQGAPKATTVAAHGGTFGTAGADLQAAATLNDRSVFIAADARWSDGHRTGTDYRAIQARVGARTLLAGGSLGVDAGLGVRNFGAADFYGAYPSYEDTRSATAVASYQRPLSSEWNLDASVDVRRHYDLYTLIRTNPVAYQNRHISWQRGARAVAAGRIDRVHAAFGAEGFDASLTSARLGNHDEQRAAGFTEWSAGSLARTLATVGSRVDWSSRTGTFFSPSAAVVTSVTPTLRLRASANRGYRSPTWTEMYYTDPANVANPELRSETFTMGEVGARVTPKWGAVDVALFSRAGKALIDWTKPAATPTAQWQSHNLESATFNGVELETSIADLARIEWKLRASGIRVSSHDADTLIGKYALSPITEAASLEATTPKFMGVRLTAISGRARRTREAPYWRTDLRASTEIRGWTVRVDGLNLGNASYRDASAMPVAGRILLLGVAGGK